MIHHPPLFIKLAYDSDKSKSLNAHYNPETKPPYTHYNLENGCQFNNDTPKSRSSSMWKLSQ